MKLNELLNMGKNKEIDEIKLRSDYFDVDIYFRLWGDEEITYWWDDEYGIERSFSQDYNAKWWDIINNVGKNIECSLSNDGRKAWLDLETFAEKNIENIKCLNMFNVIDEETIAHFIASLFYLQNSPEDSLMAKIELCGQFGWDGEDHHEEVMKKTFEERFQFGCDHLHIPFELIEEFANCLTS